MVELIEQLRAEHALIDDVVGALVCAVERGGGTVPAEDVTDFVAFFRLYAADFHHGGEEGVLFPELVRHAEVPGDRGPLVILAEDHERMAAMVTALEREASRATVAPLVEAYWEHIDKENSVLLPESEDRLRRGGIRSLPGREPTPEQERARQTGLALIRRYPPADDPSVVRGDGCILCSAFGTRCAGIEKEWWNSWEWQYHRSLDEG